MSKNRLAVVAAGLAAALTVSAEEAPQTHFDQGVDVTPAIESARRGALSDPVGVKESAPAREDQDGMVWVAMEDADAKNVRGKIDLTRREVLPRGGGITLFPVKPEELPRLSQIMHERRNRCGGFFAFDSKEEALSELARGAPKVPIRTFTVTNPAEIGPLLESVREESIRETIEGLASFHNRYYKSDTGVAAAHWIRDRWSKISEGRSDISVELFAHKGWPQPSVIAKIQGTKEAGKVIVLGGHEDSIGSPWGGSTARAPGADDDASGIAVLTEALRVIVAKGYHPERTVHLIAYAAEEVGLRGSREIAARYAEQGVDVQGAVQFDMTSFKGSSDGIYFITDHTNAALTAYLGRLIDQYVGVPWGTTKCGYACSDHASWTRNGFPSAFPFEATKSGANRNIHSSRDTLANVGGDAEHAVPFAKLAVAYIVETAKSPSDQRTASARTAPKIQ